MLIDGEKWACEACIRGHRVSSCQHSERPLSHINRKGRPMSQCPHCRGLRKSRANHVKCECGVKPHSKKECPKEPVQGSVQSGNRKQCCCSHGSPCTCSAKKDSNLAVAPASNPAPNQNQQLPTVKSPRQSPFKSEPAGLSHRHKSRKDTGKHLHPYSIPRSQTYHSSSGFRRSADLSPSSDGLSDTNTRTRPRRAVSESSYSVPNFDQVGSQVPSIEIPYAPLGQARSSPITTSYQQQSRESACFSDVDALLESANLTLPPVDWTTFDLGYGLDTVPPSLSQPASFGSYDYNNYRHLTRSPSGEVSDSGDISPIPSIHMQTPDPPHGVRRTSDASDLLGTSSSFLEVPQHQFVTSPAPPNEIDIDSILRGSEAGVPPPVQAHNLPPGPQEFVQYFSSQPISIHQGQSYVTVDGGASQPYVTHAPLQTAVSEPAWFQPPHATTSPLPTTSGPFVHNRQWSQ